MITVHANSILDAPRNKKEPKLRVWIYNCSDRIGNQDLPEQEMSQNCACEFLNTVPVILEIRIYSNRDWIKTACANFEMLFHYVPVILEIRPYWNREFESNMCVRNSKYRSGNLENQDLPEQDMSQNCASEFRNTLPITLEIRIYQNMKWVKTACANYKYCSSVVLGIRIYCSQYCACGFGNTVPVILDTWNAHASKLRVQISNHSYGNPGKQDLPEQDIN